MEQVDVAVARWAVGPGLPVIAEVTAAIDAGGDPLAIGTRLRSRLDPALAAFAVAAAIARRRARAAGVAGADELVLTREAAEQASHPAVARWRAGRAVAVRDRLAGRPSPLVDLCAGTGADAVALATAGGAVVAVERDPGRAVLARHRAAVLGVPVEVRVGDALAPPVDLAGLVVHADPDRRDDRGARARTLAGHGPAVDSLLVATSGVAGVLVTIAPGVDWADPALPPDAGLTFVEHDGRLVEAVLETGVAATARARAVLLPGGAVAERHDEEERLPVGPVGSHLVVPSPALVRARLHDRVGASHDCWRLADRRALLTADGPVDGPWLASEAVLAVLPPRPRALRRWLRTTDAAAAADGVEVVVHGVQVAPERFLRDAGAPRGPHGVRVHLVRRDGDAIAVVTRSG